MISVANFIGGIVLIYFNMDCWSGWTGWLII